jgi:hypothetical protein
MFRRSLMLACMASLVLTANSVAVADVEGAAWEVTSTSTPYEAKPAKPAKAFPAVRASDASAAQNDLHAADFKTDCWNQSASRNMFGWTPSRYEQCFAGHRKVELKVRPAAPTTIASVEFDYILMALAPEGARRIDYQLVLENYRTLGGQERNIAELVIGMSGCAGNQLNCTPSPMEKRATLEGWKSDLRFAGTVTTPNGIGDGPHAIVKATLALGLAVESNMPNIDSWYDEGAGFSRIRFDSAGAVAGKHHGAVFTDHIPTYDLLAIADQRGTRSEIMESARHIDDALHHPERTFPSYVGKSVPGGSFDQPLHRLIDASLNNKNRDTSGPVCRDVWGGDYDAARYNCDEYPFASTYEGAYTSTNEGKNIATWRGSARPIWYQDNQKSGNYLTTQFYTVHRVLDGDAFVVRMQL